MSVLYVLQYCSAEKIFCFQSVPLIFNIQGHMHISSYNGRVATVYLIQSDPGKQVCANELGQLAQSSKWLIASSGHYLNLFCIKKRKYFRKIDLDMSRAKFWLIYSGLEMFLSQPKWHLQHKNSHCVGITHDNRRFSYLCFCSWVLTSSD